MTAAVTPGQECYNFAASIFPICRSLTGDGVRETLAAIRNEIRNELRGSNSINSNSGSSELSKNSINSINGTNNNINSINSVSTHRRGVTSTSSSSEQQHTQQPAEQQNYLFSIKSVPSGTQVFDWTVPKEWKIREAYIETEDGERIIDFKENNLHVMGYSTPVDKWVSLDELKGYIYTQPEQPNVIPYVTSYYKERFGFCMSERQNFELKPGRYHIVIDSELFDGVLNYGEVLIPATASTSSASSTHSTAQERSTTTAQESSMESKADNSAEGSKAEGNSAEGSREQEIFFSTYICHPSMANNECSGPALATVLIKYVAALPSRRYNYRFI